MLGLGVFISTISQTAGQAIQTAFFFLLPQILLSGMIFPLEAMAAGVRWIGYLLPLTYFTMISQGIMLRGAPITSLWLPFVVLAAMAVVVFTGATLRFRRDLAPGRPGQPGPARPAAAAAEQHGGNRVTYSVRSATVRFGPTVALDDVTVEVPGGSVVAVVGGDGAGKSTLAARAGRRGAAGRRHGRSAAAAAPRLPARVVGQLGRADRDAEHRLRRGHLRPGRR